MHHQRIPAVNTFHHCSVHLMYWTGYRASPVLDMILNAVKGHDAPALCAPNIGLASDHL